MNKPSWDDAPEWANWLAMDSNGGWWWFEKQPKICDGTYPYGFWRITDFGGNCRMANTSMKWTESLEERLNGN